MQHLLIALVCLAILIKSAEVFIDQVSAIAKKFKISSFIVGFVLISFGTALPDLVISTYSASQGDTSFAISTTMGSAFVNISLLAGILGLITKYKLQENDLEKNIPVTIAATVAFIIIVLLFGGRLTWVGGIIAIGIYIFATLFLKKQNTVTEHKEKTKLNPLFLVLAFVALALSGKYASESFLRFADYLKIQDSMVGFFVVGVGISVPELVASLQVLKKGNLELSLGNLLGAFLINILIAPSIASFFTPLNYQPFVFDLLYILFSLIMFLFFALLGKEYYISKKEGIGLILIYILFVVLQILL